MYFLDFGLFRGRVPTVDAGGYAPSKACSLYGTGEYKLSFGEGIRYGNPSRQLTREYHLLP